MKKLKDLFKKLGDNYVSFFKDYIVTNILIYISTILTIIFLNKDIALDLFKYEIFFVANAFTVENYFKNKTSRIIGYIVAFIIAFILGFLFNNYENEFGNFFIFYVISMPSINLIHIIKESKLKIHEYLLQIFNNLLITTVINIILNIGVMMVLAIIVELLIPNSDFDLYLRTEIALLGFYTIPAYLFAFVNKDSKVTDLANNLLKYVIIPLTYIAVLVVYLYILKIFITHNMPSNSIFAIILALFIEAIPVFVLIESFDFKNKILKFINNNISYIFIPLYLLQAYAIIIRVATYGLTKSRYLGLMTLIVEAIILFLMKFKKRKYLIYAFYVIIAASFIALLVPGINYEDASIKYHVNVIDNMLKEKKVSELNGEELAKISASYSYLKDENALDKLSVEIKDNEVKIVEPYSRSYFYKSYTAEEKAIDVAPYSKMEVYYGNKTNNDSLIDINGYQVDVKEEVEKLIHDEEVKDLIYKLDDKTDFYVTALSISGKDEKLEYVDISGYILTK